MRPVAAGEPLSLVPIAVARWAQAALHEATGAAVSLKWPNDLYVGRRKLGGVIAESRTQGDETCVAVGVGVNVLGPAETPRRRRSDDRSRRKRAARPRSCRCSRRSSTASTGSSRRPGGRRRCASGSSSPRIVPGDRLTIRRNGDAISGAYLGLDASGFLRLKTEAGETTVATGEVAVVVSPERAGDDPARRRRRQLEHGPRPLARRRRSSATGG